ncbi:bifunctional 5,10-methylenetetrahydrofolate dehydrogenase/5,10-methenyltetrahydrofolate cyclohydrolase [Candidatus Deianiraea vastatrix]|uniref:Bifunctional protein FolD n=1 Tax=Candidatus Deianiraea vastatrix TaxID=2163644 RepID=A0A5B8XDT2_9RICK|nr:bifunctional 5,10-methylenetetrahydrofolate dehydrogenase/5,10-methenyltetrahydrofolate cyclohydrolase [Candidatus Deianiraea vastatrix]QED23423.1 Bifunctional protein FolD protein [Candidatus Deianiraea vastatrix]
MYREKNKMKEKKILNGKDLSKSIIDALKLEVKSLKRLPSLRIILVGNDTASQIYTGKKVQIANEIGIEAKIINFPDSVSFIELKSEILKMNLDRNISGIIVQLPLPKHLNAIEICNLISPKKDIDGLCFENVGKLALGCEGYFHKPCTPSGIMTLLDSYKINLEGKKCLILNRSNIVGKPLFQMLLAKNAFVKIAHRKVLDPEISSSDAIFSAVGVPNFIKPEMIKSGCVLIDIGISRDKDEKICGDIDPRCAEIASFMTPVPGGIGPMTIASLMKNLVNCVKYFD